MVPSPGTSSTVLLTQLSRRVYRFANEEVLGMRLKAYAALTYLRDKGAIPQQSLGELCHLDPNNLVLVLNELEEAGYVVRRRDPSDRRRHIVEITPEGTKALEAAERGMASIEDDVLASLGPEERDTLRTLLARALESEGVPGSRGVALARLSDVADLTVRLVEIDSVNPALVAGGAGETEIARFVAGWARDAGLEADVLEATPGRPSVLVRARGTGGGRTLLLCGHIDTVNVEGMAAPHAPRLEGDRLHGRGAYDMKAGVAAALIACREAAALELAGDVVVAAVADEEHASLGVQEALRAVVADAAIVTEPTELELAIAHKGFVWAEIEVTGRAAHGSRPHLGVDAIVKAGPVLTALGELDQALVARTHPLLGRGSVHASLIEGGAELSSYPARCLVGLERRTLPGETAAHVEAELEALLERCRATDPELVAQRRTLLVREPFEVERTAEIVGLVGEAAVQATGTAPAIAGVSFWADAAFIAAAGIPTVLFGPGGEGAHALEEWVSVADTEAVARTLLGVAERFSR